MQSIVASVVLILLPLAAFSGTSGKPTRGRRLPIVAYFGLLGLGFMFLEIAFIQKLMLFLHYPVYAVAVVLTSFMFFSGVGSYLADRMSDRSRRLQPLAIAALLLIGTVLVLGSRHLFDVGMSRPDPARIAFGLALLAPLALLMGMPFPFALQHVSDRIPRLVPWAWAVNGCLSVTGATLATLIAILFGFRILVFLPAVCYLGTIPVFAASRTGAPPSRPETSGGSWSGRAASG